VPGIGFLKLLLGAALFLALLALVDLRRLWASLAAADGLLLGCALAAAVAAVVVLEAWRFKIAFAGWELGYGAALRITLAGQFVGSFTPGALGSEIYKLYAVRRRERGMALPFVKLALLRIIGALGVSATAGAAWLAAPDRYHEVVSRLAWRGPGAAAPFVVAGGVALAVLGLTVLVAGRSRLAPRLREMSWRGRELLAEVRLRQTGEIFLLSLGVALLRGLSLALLVRSFGETARFGDLLVVTALSVLTGVLPISPAGLGVQEGVVAGCLVLLRVPPPAAVAIALVSRAFLWLFAACGGWVLAVSRRAPSPPPAGEL
jgi:uncharacterized membrane protein YbhN (UPF0104 family)